MRGKAIRTMAETAISGITPAYAGKRHYGTGEIDLQRDHPRVCGEKADLEIPIQAVQGSPPRMRGKAISSAIQTETSRITPAYAGKRLIKVYKIKVSLIDFLDFQLISNTTPPQE